jgi:thymidylate synthase (FAD)
MYMSGTLRSWVHYLQVRTEEGTQKEHREIANQIKEILAAEFPSVMAAAFPIVQD